MKIFCISLYGSSLWIASLSYLRSLEIAYNNLLRKILELPRRCHCYSFGVVGVCSIYNTVIRRSGKLIASAHRTGCHLLVDVFNESASLAYTSYNSM